MKTYPSFEAAKIENPEEAIYVFDDDGLRGFCSELQIPASQYSPSQRGFKLCNPANHCITNNKFISSGKVIVRGDIVLDDKKVVIIDSHSEIETYNSLVEGEDSTYILSAAALEEKPKRTKVEYVKCDIKSEITTQGFIGGDVIIYMGPPPHFHCELNRDTSMAVYSLHCNKDAYRRIETEIDERQEFIEAVSEILPEYDKRTMPLWIGKLFDSGKFKLV